MEKTRIIVVGSREYDNYEVVAYHIARIIVERGIKDPEIISGCARGVDKLGERFAHEMGYTLTKFPANWRNVGKEAGMIRNEKMAVYASSGKVCGILIAFPYVGRSAGTRDMIRRAEEHDLDVYVYEQLEEKDEWEEMKQARYIS